MTGRTHDLAAATALGVVFVLGIGGEQILTLSTIIASLFANQIGGMVPDIDQPTAPFWRSLPAGNVFGKLFGKMSGGHRFLTHSVLGVALIGYGAYLLLTFLSPVMGSVNTGLVWWAFMIGVVSHLFMDMFTKEGVPLLLPLPVKFGIPPLRRFRMTTGEFLEHWLVLPVLIVFNIWFYIAHYDLVINILRSYIV